MDKYFIDKKDVEKEWGIIFEKGTHNELLKFPERRDEYSQVWKDQSGTERYTDEIFFASRTLNLSLVMVGDGEDDFTAKLQDFRNYIMNSGYFSLDCARLNLRFKLLYKNMTSYTKMTHLKKNGKVAARFALTLTDDFPAEARPIPGIEYGGYGVEWDVGHADPLLTRIAEDMNDHANLPFHSKIRACTLNDDGTVNYYLDDSDKTLKEDGSTPAVLDGSDGQVMVEIPEHYMNFETEGDTRRVTVSENYMPGAVRIPKRYVSAYEASESGGKLESVSGAIPISNQDRPTFRIMAESRGEGWEQYTYAVHKDIFWLYMIEYANRNVQDAYQSSRDTDGYRQGGLGDGVTTVASADWTNFNSQMPFVPAGVCDSIGADCGVHTFNVAGWPGGDIEVEVPCYRGIENIYGHIYKCMDGINILTQSENAGGKSKVYYFESVKHTKDNGVQGARFLGNMWRVDADYYSKIIFGKEGEILPNESAESASSTTYWCDRSLVNIPVFGMTVRGCFVGGYASIGASGGLGLFHSRRTPSIASSYRGSRLCYLPEGR